ncbi:MAG: hypothetical protein RSF75_05535, partial [Acidaminococcaceae bacterium]
QEPCVLQDFYLDAIAIVVAGSLDEALAQLQARHEGWRVEDLRKLEPQVYPVTTAQVIFTEIRGSIEHL